MPDDSDVVYRCANVNNASFSLTLNATAQDRGCSYQQTGVARVSIQPTPCYTVANITRPFINACSENDFPGGTTRIQFTPQGPFTAFDEGIANITTPFPVSLYSTITTVGVSTNGFMTLGTILGGPWYIARCPLQDNTPPGDVIFAFWADLVVRESPDGGECHATRTTATGREFVVTWDRARQISNNDPEHKLSFSIILKENSRDVEVTYGTFKDVSSSFGVVGVQNADRNKATTWSCAEDIIPPGSNTAVKFTWLP